MIRVLVFVLSVLSYAFAYTQDLIELTDLSFFSEQTILQSGSEHAETDTFSYDLRVAFDEYDKPKFYYAELVTPVCESGECYLVEVKLFWDLVGTYLGFKLPPDKVLTKIDHKHFEQSDYEKLHRILGNLNWPLAGYAINELIIDSTKMLVDSELDAYSGATVTFVKEQDNIPGALYTIYTLWEFVHNQDIVKSLQTHTLSLVKKEDLEMVDFLSSDKIADRLWALNNLHQTIALDAPLRSSLFDLIADKDYFMAYSAISAIKPVHLDSDTLQLGLFSKYKEVNHSLKKMIIEKLMEAPYLNSEIVRQSRSLLTHLNGQQLGVFLKLYAKHNVDDLVTCRTISNILQNENKYISQKAYTFLMAIQTRDSVIMRNLRGY